MLILLGVVYVVGAVLHYFWARGLWDDMWPDSPDHVKRDNHNLVLKCSPIWPVSIVAHVVVFWEELR